MVEIKVEYPVIMPNGQSNNGLIKHWAEDENGNKYLMKQVETGAEHEDAIDVYPCPYTYQVTDKIKNHDETSEIE